jgi:hypothetical protein
MLIWRLFLKVVDLFLSNPIRALALVVFTLAAVNYKTLIANLPDAVPEVDNWLAELAPRSVTMAGSIVGVGKCWRMNFTFFEESGSPLLKTRSHVTQVTGENPQATLSLPHRASYLVRLETEVPLANPDNCLPIGTGAILKSNAVETVLRGIGPDISLVNRCDFTDANRCDLRVR